MRKLLTLPRREPRRLKTEPANPESTETMPSQPSPSKIITALIYMNSSWEQSGGRLRLLRSAHNLDDVLVEVPPTEGTLVTFRRSENSFHGHKPFIGVRRVIQLNWVTGRGIEFRELFKHRASAWIKKLLASARHPHSVGR